VAVRGCAAPRSTDDGGGPNGYLRWVARLLVCSTCLSAARDSHLVREEPMKSAAGHGVGEGRTLSGIVHALKLACDVGAGLFGNSTPLGRRAGGGNWMKPETDPAENHQSESHASPKMSLRLRTAPVTVRGRAVVDGAASHVPPARLSFRGRPPYE
jgi:hypothetical protein